MEWLADNAVLVAFLFAAVVVLAAMALAGWRGWRLYRAARAEGVRVTALTDSLSAEAARLQARADAIPRRQAEIQGTVGRIQREAAVLGVMASHATAARRTLMAPLRYIGR
ncbi:MAG: hypothetical protein KDC33_12310 [Thermoleophilia bacterium]|nr:hypothetical protein [Thermoleophilia bacterium]